MDDLTPEARRAIFGDHAEIRASSIHGVGPFAVRPIKAGEVFLGRPRGFRGYNHSCTPNVELKKVFVDEGMGLTQRLRPTALRDIQPDEELTVSYGSYVAGRRCNCPSCRGAVIGCITPHDSRVDSQGASESDSDGGAAASCL